MLDALTTEMLLSLAAVTASILATGGSAMALWSTRQKHEKIDIDAAVARAPYHRLHNLVPVSDDEG